MVGCIAFIVGLIDSISTVWSVYAIPVPRQIATYARFPWSAFLQFLFLPVGPFAAWGILTVLCDVRDSLLVDDMDEGPS